MIQELFGGASLIGGEKNSFSVNNNNVMNNGNILQGTPTSSPSTTTNINTSSGTTSKGTNTTTTTTTSSENLRCPRCDSSNTKFCYYNNYNLTQPRHFCKTCRRYWTKGGALRNVPIGGGCRKNKSMTSVSTITPSSASKPNNNNINDHHNKLMKTLASHESVNGRSSFGFNSNYGFMFDLENHPQLPSTTPLLWASPQNSHILALLRATQRPNTPNPITTCTSTTATTSTTLPVSLGVKKEGASVATHMMMNEPLGLDPLNQQAPSLGLCSSFWKNNGSNTQAHQQTSGFVVGGSGGGHDQAQNSGLQELYQRLKSSTNYYTTPNDHSSGGGPLVVLGNVAGSSPSSSTSPSSSGAILDSDPIAISHHGGGSTTGGEQLAYWNPAAFSWSDLPTSNGTSYPN